MSTKTLRDFKIKAADRGEVTAVFATLNAKDSDGDVTLPGAFEDGAEVVISAYGHTSWQGLLPVGKGTIAEVGNEAILNGRFFLDTTAGRETFTVVKELGPKGQWSYGYDPVKYSFGDWDGEQVRFLEQLKTYEVSPVLLGAGVGTRTLAAKAGMRFGEHAESVLADVEQLLTRSADVQAMRAEKGKTLAETSRDLLARLKAALTSLDALLADPPPASAGSDTAKASDDLARAQAALIRARHHLTLS